MKPPGRECVVRLAAAKRESVPNEALTRPGGMTR